MLGAGFFAVTGLATQEAGVLMLLSWVIAMAVAGCCATSALRLAAHHTNQGHGSAANQLAKPIVTNPMLVSLTYWAGICAKTAAAGVLVLTIHAYMFPESGIWLAAALAVAALAVHWLLISDLPNIFLRDENDQLLNPAEVKLSDVPGIVFNRFIAVFIFGVLLFVALAAISSRQIDPDYIVDNLNASWGIVPAAGLLFFRFRGL